MKIDPNQVKALVSEVSSRIIELKSEYALEEVSADQGKLDEWQHNIENRWRRLIEAEGALKEYLKI